MFKHGCCKNNHSNEDDDDGEEDNDAIDKNVSKSNINDDNKEIKDISNILKSLPI